MSGNCSPSPEPSWRGPGCWCSTRRPSPNLDLRSEGKIERALDVILEGRTAGTIIAHRLATAMRADRIAVVDAGGIAELGTHDELVALGGRVRGDVRHLDQPQRQPGPRTRAGPRPRRDGGRVRRRDRPVEPSRDAATSCAARTSPGPAPADDRADDR